MEKPHVVILSENEEVREITVSLQPNGISTQLVVRVVRGNETEAQLDLRGLTVGVENANIAVWAAAEEETEDRGTKGAWGEGGGGGGEEGKGGGKGGRGGGKGEGDDSVEEAIAKAAAGERRYASVNADENSPGEGARERACIKDSSTMLGLSTTADDGSANMRVYIPEPVRHMIRDALLHCFNGLIGEVFTRSISASQY